MLPRHDAGKLGCLLAMLVVLQGCAPSEESDGGGESVSAPVSEEVYAITVSGSVGDGPVASAMLSVLSATGELLSNALGNPSAVYSIDLQTKGRHYPLVIEAAGGLDLVTGAPLDFTMRSVLLTPKSNATANINPFTTLAHATARRMSGGLTRANITNALDTVIRRFNMGMSSAVSLDPLTTPIDDYNLAEIMRASESLAEVFRRVSAAVGGSGFFPPSKQSVIDAIAADLVDGVLDGRGSGGANRRVAATTVLVTAQVALETMRNELEVDGQVATAKLDNVVSRLASGPSPDLTDSLPLTSDLIDLASDGVEAAIALDATGSLESLKDDLGALRSGMSSATVRQALPGDVGLMMLAPIIDVATGTRADFNVVLPGPEDPVAIINAPPVISGTPNASATQGVLYEFVPTATDDDGDALTFSVVNAPAWTIFDGATGRLSGTPSAGDVGTYSAIGVQVSDGRATVSLPAFSITVLASSPTAPPPSPPPPAPNAPPTISGTPGSSVVQDFPYAFVPTAGDPDGDTLTFTIANRPAWATFNSMTGRLSGTPGAGDVGTYANVRIMVSDGIATASLPAFSITVEAIAFGSAMLSWQAPMMNEDGSPLTDLVGFRIRWGQSPGRYPSSTTIMNPGVASYLVENLLGGTHYFVVTALNSAGMESRYSNEASKTIP